MDSKPSFDQLYLDRLSFNPSLKKMWLSFFVYRFRVIILLIALISIWGIYSFLKLPRESNPEVKIPIAVVITSYPGASPADVEELVTKKIESKLSGIKGIDTMTSQSANSVSSVVVEFDPKVNLDDAIRRVKDKAAAAKPNLPQDAGDPTVSEISFDDSPILTLALSGPYDGFTLYDYASDLKDELAKINGIRDINITGGDQRQIEVAYHADKLIFYGISIDQANAALKTANITIPSGNFEGSVYVYPVRVDARVYDAAQIADLPVASGNSGSAVFFKDIADVSEIAIEKTSFSRIASSGHSSIPAVTLSVVKQTGGNIITTVDETIKATQAYAALIPGLQYDITYDSAKYIRQDFDELTRDFILTIILVMTVLMLLIGLKEALVAGLAIPLVFFITFGVMNLAGITLNFLSTFSLLLSLGLIVDDAIVVVSATKQYMRTGKFTPEEAVLLVLNDFKIVLTTTTLTTVWAFLPLLFSSGIMGEFLKSIPITISVTLIASLAIALMVNHPLAAILERIRPGKITFFSSLAAMSAAAMAFLAQGGIIQTIAATALAAGAAWMIYWYENRGKRILEENRKLMVLESKNDELIKNKLRSQGTRTDKNIASHLMHGIINLSAVLPLYQRYLSILIDSQKKRKIFLGAVAALFAAAVSLPLTGIVKTEFFPADDFGYMYINIEAPTGWRLSQTDLAARQVEEILLRHSEIDNFSTTVGASVSVSGGFQGGASGVSDKAAVTINLVDKKYRAVKSYELEEILRRELAAIKDAKVTVVSLRGGPPSGSAFEAQITGDDVNTLKKTAEDLKPLLESIPGVVNASVSLKESSPEYTFTLDQIKMANNGMTAVQVGSALRMAISGTEATTILRESREIKVIAKFSGKSIPTLEAIQNLQIANRNLIPIYLKDVAIVSLEPSVEKITRINEKRTVLLSSDITANTTPNAVLSEFEKKLATVKLPDGYAVSYGGANETNAESVQSIIVAMGLAFILIIATLIAQFNSFGETLIVLITVPLALIGVFFGLAILRIPLSFPGLIGILALFGIVVKNAIILIDKINLNLHSGIATRDAIIDAGKSRFEAIFITSFCTIIGIVPITLSSITWQALGVSIICGLAVSSFFTLFVVPSLFASFVKREN